jgi:hypothetical protein
VAGLVAEERLTNTISPDSDRHKHGHKHKAHSAHESKMTPKDKNENLSKTNHKHGKKMALRKKNARATRQNGGQNGPAGLAAKASFEGRIKFWQGGVSTVTLVAMFVGLVGLVGLKYKYEREKKPKAAIIEIGPTVLQQELSESSSLKSPNVGNLLFQLVVISTCGRLTPHTRFL